MGGSYKWPSVDEVVEYRCNVRNIILKVIADTPLQLPVTMDSPWVSTSGFVWLFAVMVVDTHSSSPLVNMNLMIELNFCINSFKTK